MITRRTKHFSRSLPLIGLVLLALAACAPEPPTPELVDPTGFVTYIHPTGVFSLDLPPNWIVNDTSDEYAINVAFSPPDSPEALLSVYLVSEDALSAAEPSTAGGQPTPEAGPTPEGQARIDLEEPLIQAYLTSLYAGGDSTYREMGREPQPDGSLRLVFVLDAPQGTSSHNDFLQLFGPYFVAFRVRLPDDQAQLRTISRVVNTLSIDEENDWASKVAPKEEDDESASQGAVGFVSLNTWADRNGGFQIVGQVRNRTELSMEFIRITAQLYDSGNRLLGEQDDFVSSDLISPGGYAPFSIVFTEGLPPGTVRYQLDASARYADLTARTFYGPENFAVTSAAEFDENGLLVISGQVRNEGPQAASLVKVIATVFDDNQRVVATDTTLVDPPSLENGDVSDYTVTFVELGGNPSTFLVTAQGIIEE
jgi:hypothetical protein